MIVDLFAGPGGWDEALRQLGRTDVIGLEWDAAACATRAAAGHRTVRTDVGAYPPDPFTGRVAGLIASPPCPAFSAGGKREGLPHVDGLCRAAHDGRWDFRPVDDPLVWLSLEPGRWIEQLRPAWVAMEQAPAVLPLWRAYAHRLRAVGYRAWAGLLSAECYGVPQTRKRAVLMAATGAPVRVPLPARRAYDARAKGSRPDDLFGLPAPVTMADALGRPRGSVQLRHNMAAADRPRDAAGVQRARGANGEDYYLRFPVDRPAPTLTTQAGAWAWESTDGGEERLSVSEAATLQGFRADYPWQGNQAEQFQQIGNAVPPPLAAAILRMLV